SLTLKLIGSPAPIFCSPGADVVLPCHLDPELDVRDLTVAWLRTDRSDGYVLLYRDQLLDPEYQLQSYRDRVTLTDLQNRTISLILKNVRENDEGTYECRVFQRNSPRQQRSVIGVDPVSSINQRIISVESGHDVTLPCEAPDGGTIIVVEWSRTDLKNGCILLYRDKQLDPEYQLQSYRDRVDLQMKNRNISLILKNVTADDEGTYECRIVQRNSPRQQRSVKVLLPCSMSHPSLCVCVCVRALGLGGIQILTPLYHLPILSRYTVLT
uniref:Ig-like domain-containing protein n=1 Tax=Gouania willdenowi TaxID=441366 RepID=A0A8C5DEW3_GOUWI